MTAHSLPQESETAGAAVFELERFEWTAPDRIEVAGRWSRLRARRFIRPTLVLGGPGGSTRMLALLEHKPWEPADGETWVAAFAWTGDVVEIESAELSLATGIELRLPQPRPLPGAGKRPRWRAPKRIVAEALGEEASAAASRQDAAVFTDGAGAAAAPEPAALSDGDDTTPMPAVEPLDAASVARMPAREAVDEITALRAERDAATAETATANAAVQRLERERDAEVRRVESERDSAREAQKGAIRERVDAIRERDQAVAERDEAVERLKDATTAESAAIADRDAAFRERDHAAAERDAALRERDAADRDRDRAIEEREETLQERASARRAREMAERAAPPAIERAGSPMELWAPRLVAMAILAAFLIVVVLLFHGA